MRAVMHLFARVQHGSRADVVHCDAWMLQLCECHDIYTRDMTHSNTSHDAPWQVHHFFGCNTSCEIFRLFCVMAHMRMCCTTMGASHCDHCIMRMLQLCECHDMYTRDMLHSNTSHDAPKRVHHYCGCKKWIMRIFFYLFFHFFFPLLRMQCVHHANVTIVNMQWVRHGSHANMMHHHECTTVWWMHQLLKFLVVAHMRMWCTMMSVL